MPHAVGPSPAVMLKIQRVHESKTTTLIVSGRIEAEHVPDLNELVRVERAIGLVLVLDLTEVSLVDVEVVRFLVHCEGRGIHILGCPAYIGEWMAREKGPR